MTSPTVFTSRTARFDLPLLFAGQAQKEFTVNEAFSRIASLLHPLVEGEASTPPGDPDEGQSWLVGSSPTGDWAGYEEAIASWSANDWLFILPQRGLKCFDAATGATLSYDGGWNRPALPDAPTGGTTRDTEARAAIADLISALQTAGIA